MHRLIGRAAGTLTAAAALSASGLAGVSAAGAASQMPQPVQGQSQAIVHGLSLADARLWVQRYNGPGNRADYPMSVAVSPGGGRVYVTGYSNGGSSGYDCATAAYNAATGNELWLQRYNGPANRFDSGNSVAVSPDGSTVFVTGDSYGSGYATIAYNAATGARLWASLYQGPAHHGDGANSVAVSPDGRTVFVTGTSNGGSSSRDYATIAYNAATGAQRWVNRYNGPANGDDGASSLAVSPRGGTVFVTGSSKGSATGYDYATIAYNAATGARLWVNRYNGPGNDSDGARSVAVAPTGDTVFVTGDSYGRTSESDFATIALNAATGAQRWVKRYNGPANGSDYRASLAVSPGGQGVFVTGVSPGRGSGDDYATVHYSTGGAQLWVRRYNGPANGPDLAWAVASARNAVYVTGYSRGATRDYATVAYNAVTGERLWVQRYNGPANASDHGIAVAARGGRAFVTGYSQGPTSGFDYATIGYNG